MGLFSKLFKKKRPMQEKVTDSNRDFYGYINILRDDGTFLNISELLDKDGNHQCKTVIDQRTGEQVIIPQYQIMRMNESGQCRVDVISMELSASALQDPQYASWIANNMLNAQNIDIVLNQQYGYAGTIQTNNGKIVRSAYRPGVLDVFAQEAEADRNERLQAHIRGMDVERYRIYQEAQNIEYNIKTDHAQRLGPEIYNNRNSEGYDR